MANDDDFIEDPVTGLDTGTTRIPMGMGETLRPDVVLEPEGAEPEGGESANVGGLGVQIFRVFIENKLAVAGLLVIIGMVLFCFLGPHLYHTNQTNQQAALLNNQNAPPGNGHPLCTDGTGFDILGRLMYGGQTSLIVGFASAFVATVVGVL
jgi:peptide/nickel transport system permease protein